ncbi:MAG: hypothetical protein AAF433_04970 [Bacteroidota bacterium]
MNNLLERLRPLARDLFILVAGIMLSLLLNDWRENRIARGDEQRVMQQLKEDLAQDTLVLGMGQQSIEMLDGFVAFLMSEGARDPDSLMKANIMMWQVSSFTPLPLQRTAFNELTYQNSNRNIRHPELISQAIDLHEGRYNLLRKVVDMHGNYLLEDLVPWYHHNLPSNKGSELTPDELQRVATILEDDVFQNKVFWLKILMANVNAGMEQAKSAAVALLEAVNEEY